MAAQLEVAMGGMIQGGSASIAWPPAPTSKKRSSGAFWEEEVVQLMMGRPLLHHPPDVSNIMLASSTSPLHNHVALPIFHNSASSTTLDLLGSASCATTLTSLPPPPLPPLASDDPEPTSSCCFDLDADTPLPAGWEKCLNLQTGSIYYLNRTTGVSTSCDPRKATALTVNWPTSPSSSSDLTFEANVSMASSSKSRSSNFLGGPNNDEPSNLDLTLSLKPSSPGLRSSCLNHSLSHDLQSDINHKLKSLISSQGSLNKQSFSSCVSALPVNSSRSSFGLPICTSSAATASAASSLLLGSLGTSIATKESISKTVTRSLNNGISRHISNNVSRALREEPFHACGPITKSFSMSANAERILSDTGMDATSPMMTVGCANCLMFVMLPKSCSPKCPRCGVAIDYDLPQPPSGKKPKLGFSFMN